MNEELILKMAAPSIKNGVLTYALFDKIYSMLSLREQYQVCEILHKHSIELLRLCNADTIRIRFVR